MIGGLLGSTGAQTFKKMNTWSNADGLFQPRLKNKLQRLMEFENFIFSKNCRSCLKREATSFFCELIVLAGLSQCNVWCYSLVVCSYWTWAPSVDVTAWTFITWNYLHNWNVTEIKQKFKKVLKLFHFSPCKKFQFHFSWCSVLFQFCGQFNAGHWAPAHKMLYKYGDDDV